MFVHLVNLSSDSFCQFYIILVHPSSSLSFCPNEVYFTRSFFVFFLKIFPMAFFQPKSIQQISPPLDFLTSTSMFNHTRRLVFNVKRNCLLQVLVDQDLKIIFYFTSRVQSSRISNTRPAFPKTCRKSY